MKSSIDFRAIAERSLSLHPSANLYFLLDQGGLPGLHRKLKGSSANWTSLFDCTKESAALAVAPLLVLAASDGSLCLSYRVFEWIGECGTFTSAVLMLSSPLSMAEMKSQLSARLDVILSENQAAMLRFFDPRIFESLMEVLTDAQADLFLGPAEKWTYVNRAGNIVEVLSKLKREEKSLTTLTLDQQQEFKLIELSEIDQVMFLLRSNLPKILESIPASEQYDFLEHRVSEARGAGLDSILSLAIYSGFCLLEGPRFSDNAERENLIINIKNGRYHLSI